jgi:peptide/nickel transport system permease protein
MSDPTSPPLPAPDLNVDATLDPTAALRDRIRGHKGFLTGAVLMAVLIFLAVFAPLVAPADPFVTALSNRLMPPVWADGGQWEHLLGTDHLGRDYLSRLLYGARISLLIGIGAASIGCVIGVTMGVCAGYFGGRVDQAICYILSCQLAMPGFVLILALVFLIGPSVFVVICVIGALHWAYYLVVSRAATMQIRQFDYVTAALALGSRRRQVILYEIMPNLLNQIIVIFTLEVGIAVLSEAALSFLGLGIQPPTPSWGLMIAEGRTAMLFQPWLVILPGIGLFILVIGVNMIGDGIRDVTAPEQRT